MAQWKVKTNLLQEQWASLKQVMWPVGELQPKTHLVNFLDMLHEININNQFEILLNYSKSLKMSVNENHNIIILYSKVSQMVPTKLGSLPRH